MNPHDEWTRAVVESIPFYHRREVGPVQGRVSPRGFFRGSLGPRRRGRDAKYRLPPGLPYATVRNCFAKHSKMTPYVLATCVVIFSLTGCAADSRTIVIGSKNFTENILLAELTAQHIENSTDIAVERRLNLGGTFLCHEGLLAGAIDLYPEYSGTALTAILKLPVGQDPDEVRDTVVAEYRERFQLEGIKPYGFDNTFAILVRGDEAAASGLRTISDLAAVASKKVIGFNFEFLERRDGYPGLVAAYGLRFAGEPKTMDLGLIFRALRDEQIDVGVANSTDGLIAAMNLTVLEDDRMYFPPYDAAVVARSDTLSRFSELRGVLDALGGRLDEARMRQLNHEIDGKQRRPEDVAREVLAGWGLSEP